MFWWGIYPWSCSCRTQPHLRFTFWSTGRLVDGRYWDAASLTLLWKFHQRRFHPPRSSDLPLMRSAPWFSDSNSQNSSYFSHLCLWSTKKKKPIHHLESKDLPFLARLCFYLYWFAPGSTHSLGCLMGLVSIATSPYPPPQYWPQIRISSVGPTFYNYTTNHE